MREIHLGQPGFTYSAFGSLTHSKVRMQKLKKRRSTIYLSKRTR